MPVSRWPSQRRPFTSRASKRLLACRTCCRRPQRRAKTVYGTGILKQETVQTLWRVTPCDQAEARQLASRLGLSAVVARLLINRGYRGVEEASRFLRPSLDHLEDPETLDGVREAVDRISTAIARKEKILLYGDYDVDGMTSVALLHHFFSLLPAKISCFLPRRLDEGYGLNADVLKKFKKEGGSLVVTTDCGINAHNEATLAARIGLDLIITDHHEPDGALPQAVAVINPKKRGCRYPYRDLAGVGVAFKLAWGLAKHFSGQKRVTQEFRDFLLNAIGLVALGTVADVVPLTGENRVFVRYGLDALCNTRLPGIRALMSTVGITDTLTARDVAFRLAPRLNATGRLNEPLAGLEILTTASFGRAVELARDLDSKNRYRQAIERKIHSSAREKLMGSFDPLRQRVIVLADRDWHVGVLGIVASRLAEEYYRPTILLNIDGDVARGSARSIPPFHLFNALKACEDVLIGYGGHAQAAGLRVETAKIDLFRDAFETAAADLGDEDFIPSVTVDAEVSLSDMTVSAIKQMEILSPFGQGNREPVFVARSLQLAGRVKRVGSDGQHLSFFVRGEGRGVKAIAFRWGEFADKLEGHTGPLSVVFEPQIDNFTGTSRTQLIVRDIHLD